MDLRPVDPPTVFGPVPSRRLGESLGVTNVRKGHCTYSCVYCQLGRTSHMRVRREHHFDTDAIIGGIESRGGVSDCDYVTLVADGEPTLDSNLGENISAISSLGAKVAVITNASLLWDVSVRDELANADWVSVKVDAVDDAIWRRIDRPHGRLELDRVLEGISDFASIYDGDLCSETMLVSGLNDGLASVSSIADRISSFGIGKSYISVPLRPPAEPWVSMPDEAAILGAHAAFEDAGLDVALLNTPEEGSFGAPGSLESELADIMTVHPMRIEQVLELVESRGEPPSLVDRLVEDGVLKRVEHRGTTYLITVIQSPSP